MTAEGLANNGYSKDDVREYLWEKTKFSPEEIAKFGFERHVQQLEQDPTQPLAISRTPKSLTIAIAGGASAGHAIFLPNQGYAPVSKSIEMPDRVRWDELMQKAEEELGRIDI